MSHYTTVQTRLADPDLLVAALRDLGLKEVEHHDEPKHLRGFLGDRRKQTAEVIVRRKFVGRSSNDLGFKRNPEGRFDAIISGFDRARHNTAWLGRLSQRYAYHAAVQRLAAEGFELVEESASRDGQLHLVLRRSA